MATTDQLRYEIINQRGILLAGQLLYDEVRPMLRQLLADGWTREEMTLISPPLDPMRPWPDHNWSVTGEVLRDMVS